MRRSGYRGLTLREQQRRNDESALYFAPAESLGQLYQRIEDVLAGDLRRGGSTEYLLDEVQHISLSHLEVAISDVNIQKQQKRKGRRAVTGSMGSPSMGDCGV